MKVGLMTDGLRLDSDLQVAVSMSGTKMVIMIDVAKLEDHTVILELSRQGSWYCVSGVDGVSDDTFERFRLTLLEDHDG